MAVTLWILGTWYGLAAVVAAAGLTAERRASGQRLGPDVRALRARILGAASRARVPRAPLPAVD